jgi:hypothetical protein
LIGVSPRVNDRASRSKPIVDALGFSDDQIFQFKNQGDAVTNEAEKKH